MASLEEHLRATRIISAAMIGSLLLYALTAELIRAQNAPFRGFAPFPQWERLRWILLVLALGEAGLSGVVRRALLRPRPDGPGIGQRLQTASIVTFALCESVGLFGFVLFLVSGSSGDLYVFLVLALALFAVHFPRRGRWEEWARQATPRP